MIAETGEFNVKERTPNAKAQAWPCLGFASRKTSSGVDEDRTHNLYIANVALSQLSYHPDLPVRGRVGRAGLPTVNALWHAGKNEAKSFEPRGGQCGTSCQSAFRVGKCSGLPEPMGDNLVMFQTIFARRQFVSLGILLAMGLALAVPMPGCKGSKTAAKPAGSGVAVTIFPLYDLVKRVAGPGIKVSLLLPPGVSGHGYSPSPADVKALNDAALLVANGGGLDDWIAQAYRDRAAEGLKLIHFMSLLGSDLGAFDVGTAHGDGHAEEDHEHAGPNPHVWLFPRNASKLVARVAKELSALYPDQAAAISEREVAVQLQLAALDLDYEDAIEPISDRRMITYHDAFNVLAENYGLQVVATVLSLETHDATPARVQEVRKRIEEDGVRALFIEPQFDPRAIEGLAGEVTPRILDPLGDPNRPGYESYDAMMRTNLKNLVEGLRENVSPKGSGG